MASLESVSARLAAGVEPVSTIWAGGGSFEFFIKGLDELLLRLARTESVYVPRFYDVTGGAILVVTGVALAFSYVPAPNSAYDSLEFISQRAVLENRASEQSAQMVAMRSATDNAHELIGDLRREGTLRSTGTIE